MIDNSIFEKVDNYISNLLGKEDEILQNVNVLIQQHNIPNASISPNQGKFLQILAISCNAKRILELGTMAAYSTIWLARALPVGGKVISIESDPIHFDLAKQNIINANLSDKVELRLGNALDVLNDIANEQQEPFDLIFIDADKPPYTEYFQKAIELGRPGTIIVADNVIRNAKVLDSNSTDEKVKGVQRLNEMLAHNNRVSATILQTVGVKEYDGMVIAVINRF